VLAVVAEIGARIDVDEDGAVQASSFKAEETSENGDGCGRVADG